MLGKAPHGRCTPPPTRCVEIHSQGPCYLYCFHKECFLNVFFILNTFSLLLVLSRNAVDLGFSFLFFWATPAACGTSWAGDQVCTTAVPTPSPLASSPPEDSELQSIWDIDFISSPLANFYYNFLCGRFGDFPGMVTASFLPYSFSVCPSQFTACFSCLVMEQPRRPLGPESSCCPLGSKGSTSTERKQRDEATRDSPSLVTREMQR